MEVITIQSEAFQELIKSIHEIHNKLDAKNKEQANEMEWLDLSEVCQALKISKRTVFNYINQGILSFSHLGGRKKLFFRKEDIDKIISDHYVKSFRNK
jgi:predicted DNA-binding transcriptional regulator AlpA